MRASYLWLKDFVDFSLPPAELANLLTMAGLEVENVEPVGPLLDGIIVGHVLEVRKHPNADKLTLCHVDLGGRSLEVVCGAPNVAQGQKIAFIEAGNKLPNGMLIEARPVRGVVSNGMICSGKELSLSDDAEGILVLDPNAPLGKPLREVLGPQDWALDLEITINRPDCLSHIGIAREIAAALRKPLHVPKSKVKESGLPIQSLSSIEILEPEFCPRYSARIIRGMKIAPSPDWMRLRLEAVGLRAINNVVDVTNYVLLEMGHPMHAFDFNRLEGKRISVRCAQAGEKFVTLDEQERTLDDRMLLICDGARGVALAGVMGGLNSEISEDTTDLLLESAYFDPINTRRTSKLLGLSTDSSRRFERGADPEATIPALDRAAELILQLAGGHVAAGVYDVYPQPITPRAIKLRLKRVEQILGVKVPKREIEKHLNALECSFINVPHEKCLEVQVPSFRPDLEREIDLIEEVARLHGYNQIPTAETARVPLAVPYSAKDARRQKLSDILIRLGFTQIKTPSLLAEKEASLPDYPVPIKLKNPASEDMAYLRNGLLPGLLEVTAHNLHRGTADFRIFDIGRVFRRKDGEYSEWDAVAGLLTGLHEPGRWDQLPQPASFLDLKGLVEEMLMQISLDKFDFFCYDIKYGTGDALGVRRSGQFAGFLGQVHPTVAQRFEVEVPVFAFEFRVNALVDEISERLNYRPFPKYPPVQRDLAFVMADDLPAGEVLTKMRTWGGPHLVSCDLFDVYRGTQAGEGKKSVAFRLKFQSLERTLTDAETDSAVQRLIERMAENYDAKLRS